jgi:hypothetical protein
MPATPLPVSERFFQPEITKVWFVPTIADKDLKPTRAEIDAGTELSSEIADFSGWSVTSNMIGTPDLGSRFTGQITGRTSADDSSITFYGDQGGDDVRKVLPRATKGNILIADGGDEDGNVADVFPIEVASVGKLRSAGDQAFQLTIAFAIKRQPAEDVELPAAGA